MAKRVVTVDVVSDVVCPWCYVGQKRLDRAIASVPELDVKVRWRPYQLDPTIPAEGKDRKRYMLDKFGDENRIAEIHRRIEQAGAAEGIAFDFDAIKLASNTLDAHRLMRWAGETGAAEQDGVARRLFALNFENGANIGDRDVLAHAGAEVGMDHDTLRARLDTDEDSEEVRAEIASASRMGISGVPTFILDDKYAVTGAQEADTLADALRQVAAEKK